MLRIEIERAVAARLTVHIESQILFPAVRYCQSSCRARHSTETAVVAVHDEIVKSVDSGDVCALLLLDLLIVLCAGGLESPNTGVSRKLKNPVLTFRPQCILQGSVLGPLKWLIDILWSEKRYMVL